ncbi:MAG: hypothetical protein DHS20C18_56000 [Saprospiraceae bacterium]|nr:MAG: hypothetical protein DHS20C18_56000 [Saprospiraceae bacterium]
MKRITSFVVLLAWVASSVIAQSVTLPPSGANQKSVVTQYIGALAHVTIVYNSPDVTSPAGEDRTGKIWGQLVPYGMSANTFGTAKEIPWRAGANENTIFKVSHDVMVQGKTLKAGKYGLHMIPRETGTWTVIFSKNTDAWGSYFYDQKEDVLRVEATPEACEHHEWLTYEFIDRQPNSCTVALAWEKLRIPLKIELPNANEMYVENLKGELQGRAGFNYQGWIAAANFAVQNDVALEDALGWADYAVSGPFVGIEDFSSLSAKANVLAKLERMDEAAEVMDKAIHHSSATAFQIHGYGRQLIALGMKDEALKVFQYNNERYEGGWPTSVGLARGYSAVGKYKEAIKYAKMAKEQAPDKLNKDSMAQAIEKLEKGEDIN